MQAVHSSKVSVHFYLTTWCYKPEDSTGFSILISHEFLFTYHPKFTIPFMAAAFNFALGSIFIEVKSALWEILLKEYELENFWVGTFLVFYHFTGFSACLGKPD
jgi:hypothetical protein